MKSTTSDDQVAIKLVGVCKQYTIHHEKPTLVEKFIKGRDETFTALNNINLTIKKGEKVGIIGPNGSGKTTLLKLITGITAPTSGSVFTSGKVVSLIDLEAGFHPDLSGYQNIFLNGTLLGLSKREIYNTLNHIIKYADIRQFIDTPFYTYSQGMKARLGMAVAVHTHPNIILLDEGINDIDEKFQPKIIRTIHKFIKNNGTFIMTSHIPNIINLYCNRILYIEKGEFIKEKIMK